MAIMRCSTEKMFKALGRKETSKLNMHNEASESVHLDSPTLTPGSMAKAAQASLTSIENLKSTPMS